MPFDLGKCLLSAIDNPLTDTFEYRKVSIMANQKYLDPAYGVIMRFSPEGKMSQAIASVAAATGRTESWVYRWMLPKERGGTGGLIPSKDQRMLFEYAQKRKLPLSASDFFSIARAA